MAATLAPIPTRWFTAGSQTSPVRPLLGGKLYFYAAGTTTPKDTFSDEAGLIANPNPITLDARGESPNDIRFTVGGYKLVVTDADGVRQGDALDYIYAADRGGGLATFMAQLLSSAGASLIGFIQAGAGAVYRTLQDISRETIRVKDYGGTWDGVGNDSAAVQAAFNAANGTGKKVVFNVARTKLNTTLSQNNHSHYDIDWGECQVEFAGGSGTYMLDMTQAGRITHRGGVFTGSGTNHLLKTAGSAAAQATTSPTVPNESQWTRQCSFRPTLVTGFSTALDFGNFTREYKYSGTFTGNLVSVKTTGKVVNATAEPGTVLYSALASSQAVVARGDATDAMYRYAEGLFFGGVIMDTVGTTVDVRDVYLLDLAGAQIKTSAGGIAVDITKGVCPLTREIFLDRILMQGKIRIGNGLSAQHLFSISGSSLSFSDTDGTAIIVSDWSKGVTINGAGFNSPTGAAKMFSVGANCVGITLTDLNPDTGTYSNPPTIDVTSLGGVVAEFAASFVPGLSFGGANTGITYASQSGRYYFRGGLIAGFFEVALSNKGSAVGAAAVTGLPYPCRLVDGVATLGSYTGLNSAITPVASVAKTTTVISLKNGGGGSTANLSNTDFANGSLVNGSFSYPVS